jgi:Zn-dependent M28 family amino/carboxypeptidase
MKLPSILLILTVATYCVFGQQTSPKISTQDEIKADLALVPCKNQDRLEAVRNLFKQKGAADEDIKTEKFKDIENLIVTKKGKTDEIIIVGAHYDKVKEGCGAIDNWTGIVVLANVYHTVKDFDSEKTYQFVAFDKEEPGLFGSAAMVKAIPKEKRGQYCSMVNFDSFGFSYPQILDNVSSQKMTDYALKLAKEIDMPISHFSLEGTADADSSSFKDKDIPAVTFTGLSNNWQKYLHTSNDKIENVNDASVYVGYQFSLKYIAKLDTESCSIFRKQIKPN